jgi:glutathionylspermidine synthase
MTYANIDTSLLGPVYPSILKIKAILDLFGLWENFKPSASRFFATFFR